MSTVRGICPRCEGEGEIRENPGWPDPQCEQTRTCPRCHGTGLVAIRVEAMAA